MESWIAPGHPVLRYLAVVRAARDFGLDPEQLNTLALRVPPTPGSIEEFANAVAAALVKRCW